MNFFLVLIQIIVGIALFFKMINEYRIDRKLDLIDRFE